MSTIELLEACRERKRLISKIIKSQPNLIPLGVTYLISLPLNDMAIQLNIYFA